MSGKGKKKSKAVRTINLSSFLADDQNVPSGYTVVKPVQTNWAEAMEDEPFDDRFNISNVVLPTAPKASRGPLVDLAKVPTHPPYTAYIGNLPYDIMEDDIIRFFKDLKVVSVRIPKEMRESSRLRGFGYVEFETRDHLIEALSLNNEKLRNRIVKINLADDRDHNGDRRRGGNEDHTSDWRAKDNEPWRNDSRDQYRGRGSYEGGRRYDDKYGSRDGDKYGSRDGDKYGSRDRGGRRGGDEENSWRRSGPPSDSRDYSRDSRDYSRDSRDSGPPPSSGRPVERPRLVLLPRSVPKEEEANPAPPTSIFGGAKPVNTYNREKEIVEKKLETLEISSKPSAAPPSNKPNPPPAKSAPAPVSNTAIFGQAKPVDTAARELEIERKLREQQQREEEPKNRTAGGGGGSGYTRSFGRSGGRQSPTRKPPSKTYDSDNRRNRSEDGYGSNEDKPRQTERKGQSKYNFEDGGGQKKKYTDPGSRQKKAEDKPQDYICANKFSNLVAEDSDEEEAAAAQDSN